MIFDSPELPTHLRRGNPPEISPAVATRTWLFLGFISWIYIFGMYILYIFGMYICFFIWMFFSKCLWKYGMVPSLFWDSTSVATISDLPPPILRFQALEQNEVFPDKPHFGDWAAHMQKGVRQPPLIHLGTRPFFQLLSPFGFFLGYKIL